LQVQAVIAHGTDGGQGRTQVLQIQHG
jgi:hypothetical protein